MPLVSLRQIEHRHRHVVETEGASATLTVEMRMGVIIMTDVMTVAELVSHAAAAILYHMHQMPFLEKDEHPEHARLVCINLINKFLHFKWNYLQQIIIINKFT